MNPEIFEIAIKDAHNDIINSGESGIYLAIDPEEKSKMIDDINKGKELNEYVILRSEVVDKSDKLYKEFLTEIYKEEDKSNVFRYNSISDLGLEDDESTVKLGLLINKYFS